MAKIADQLHEAYGTETLVVPVDLTVAESTENVVAEVVKTFGTVDVLINSAGASQGGLFWEIPDRVWAESFELKVMGSIRMMRAVIPVMLKNKYGRIVNIVGNTGQQPSPRLLPGSVANAAMLAVTRGLGEELAPHNVIVNAINPGPTRTERWVTLMNRLAQGSGRTVAEVERQLIIDTLRHCLGNRTHAATILGISIRTLRNKLRQYSDEGVAVPVPGTSDAATA